MTPEISVIIPAYNVENYIEKCINSVQNQDFNNMEIIVVNDSSTDNTEQVVKKLQKKDPRITLLNNDLNGIGVGPPRNFGLKYAKGDYVLFLDSDDFLEPNTLQKLYKIAKQDDLDVLIANYYKFFRGKQIPSRSKISTAVLSGEEFLSKVKYFDTLTWNKLWKTDFLKRNNLHFVGYYYEDIFFASEAYLYAKRVKQVNHYFYNYLIREGSIMNSTVSEKKLVSFIKVIERLEQDFKSSKGKPDESQRLKKLIHTITDLAKALNLYQDKENQTYITAKKILTEKHLMYKKQVFKTDKLDILQKILFYFSPFLLEKVRRFKEKL